jgi:hypothetical protein
MAQKKSPAGAAGLFPVRNSKKALRRRREITESIATVMAGLVPAIHVVQLTKQQRFATISQLRSIEL